MERLDADFKALYIDFGRPSQGQWALLGAGGEPGQRSMCALKLNSVAPPTMT